MTRYKSYTGKQLIQYLHQNNVTQILEQLAFYKKANKDDRTYQFWQKGIYPEWIQNDDMMRQKITYFHDNPVTAAILIFRKIGGISVQGIIWDNWDCLRSMCFDK